MEEDEQTIEEVLDTIGDRQARRILAEISEQPLSAKELAETCDLSPPTVYRRLDLLREQDLITERTAVVEDGNHYKVYECNFDSTVIRLSDNAYDVRIYRKENLPDRFSNLWDELGGN